MADLNVTQMNAGQVRVIDPILSNIALGYKNAAYIGDVLFPRIPVAASGGQVIQFGKESFKQYQMRRAPGADTTRMSFGYAGNKFALVEDSIEAPVPRELMRDASQVPGIDLASIAINNVMDIILLQLERDQAALALTAANYDSDHKIALSGGSLWTAANVDPQTSLDVGREAVRASIGRYPNTLALGTIAFNALRNNAAVKAHFQYTDKSSVTAEMLAAYYLFDKVVVGGAVTSDDAGAFTDVWGNNALMAYVPPAQLAAQGTPSYGYTYTMLGHPIVETPYWDPNSKSWIYGVTMEREPQIVGASSAYLIQTPSA